VKVFSEQTHKMNAAIQQEAQTHSIFVYQIYFRTSLKFLLVGVTIN